MPLVFLCGCVSKTTYQSAWQSKPVQADGRADEWQIPLRFYDADTRLNYSVSNDDEKLYIVARVVDELSQAKVMQNGLQIYIDTSGKKNKQVALLYPNPDRSADEPVNSGGSGKNMEEVKKKFSSQAMQMQLAGFKPGIPDYLPPQNEYGINVNINWDANNIMIYEASIPFKTFFKPALAPKDSLRNFDFSVVMRGFPAPKKEDGGGGNAGMPGGGGMTPGTMGSGGMNGGGMGARSMGGGRMSRMEETDPRYETNSFWVRIRLSAK